MSQFQIYRDARGEYRWRLITDGGTVIATGGEGYLGRGGAGIAIQAVKEVAASAPILEKASCRPEPPPSEHEGYSWRAEPARDWRMHTRGMLCRYQSNRVRCPTPAMADLRRPRYHSSTGVGSWWAYCGEHLYGHWIEDEVVMGWILRKDQPEASR
jgi:uncharacterized protein